MYTNLKSRERPAGLHLTLGWRTVRPPHAALAQPPWLEQSRGLYYRLYGLYIQRTPETTTTDERLRQLQTHHGNR